MGRIKPKMVKNAARELLKTENIFELDFEKNKKLLRKLDKLKVMPSKKIRNKVAGYISRLVKQRSISRKIPTEKIESLPYQ